MRSVDLSPFYRSSVGFDRLFDLLDSTSSEASTNSYPPYNIVRVDQDRFRISIAVAGFGDDDLDVEVKDRTLLVTGKKADAAEERTYLHRGIAARNFQRRFQLADHIVVSGANLENGLLNIDLAREVPEALKPRKISISSVDQAKVIEGDSKAAA